MDATNRIDLYNFTGEHIRFSSEFWHQTILPYFDNAPSEDGEWADVELP